MSSNSAEAPLAEPGPARGGHARIWQGLLGVAISIGFLWWAVKDVDLAEVGHEIRRANPWWYLLSCAVVFLTFPLRAIRWRILLESSTPERNLGPYWRAVAIGFMANNILPARAGELVRAYAGTSLIRIPFSTSLGSIAVERIFDGVILVLLLFIAVFSPGFPRGAELQTTSIQTLAITMAAVFLGGLLTFIVLVRTRERSLPIVDRIIGRVAPARLGPKISGIVRNLVAGFSVLQSTRDVARVTFWSFAVWLTNAVSIYIGFLAFDIDVTFGAALVLQSVVAFGVAVPAAPGFFGVFEKLSQLVLGIYGISASIAFSFAIGIHIGWFIPITVVGLVILARSGLTLKSLRSGESAQAAA